ncbi:unnamed protein product [Arabidopsis thaliana]|jgi:hypothetical protein|uniref:Gb/AAC33480.1 n=1 Tax=Arabidopsis thaliana TaxID=3702 RepID=Q9FLM7_ARATH|eukprot:NP_198918.1 myb family transcription factor [Arabidopsis thaliana]
MAEEKKNKKKKSDAKVDSEETGEEFISEHSSMKDKEKKRKKNKRENKDGFTGEDMEITGRESEKLGDEVFIVKKKKKSKKPIRIDSEAVDAVKKKSKKRSKETKADSEAEDDGVEKKSKEKSKETKVDSEAHDGVKRKKKKSKKESGGDVIENTESSKVSDKKKGKRKRDDTDLGAEENIDKEVKRKNNKKKPSVDSDVEDINLDSTNDGKKKRKKKKQSEDSETEENGLNSTKDAKKRRKKKKKKKQSEVSEAEEKSDKSDEDLTTPSTSSKRVKFSDQVEFFPSDDDEGTEDDDEEEVKVVRGKRFTKEEDEMVKNAVLEYIDNHALGDEGIKMVMECKAYPQLKGCWKEITSALPWRTYNSVYHRAHTIFEAGSQGIWTKEDIELVMEFQKTHGNDWKTLADAMGKHRKHVKDAWRRGRLAGKKKGHWMREEYQNLFDLVNKDLRMKAFKEKHSKHGMLKDNIPWMAISDVLETRDHVTCCQKWYEQLISPMVAKGMWANVDDYRLLEELLKLDAACIDDVDWDNLLENRDGEACRKRWNQMIIHIGVPKSKTFAEQVEILSDRYCPDIAEDREDFDNRPYDPED